jgi:hypothetical protein
MLFGRTHVELGTPANSIKLGIDTTILKIVQAKLLSISCLCSYRSRFPLFKTDILFVYPN